MLTILLVAVIFGQGQSCDYGKYFITAFPENIAFYYPYIPSNYLKITALYNDTSVDVYSYNTLMFTSILQSGETENVSLNVQLYKFGHSSRSVIINSSDYIVVLSVSQQGDSMQTHVVQPLKNLDTFYTIPCLNYSEMISTFNKMGQNISKKNSLFRLVIINSEDVSNHVIIQKQQFPYTEIILDPNGLVQLPINGSEIAIEADYKVAVLLTHPCVETSSCRCNIVVNQLRPDFKWSNFFLLPSVVNMNETLLHVTSAMNIQLSGANLEPTNFEPYPSNLLSIPSLQSNSQYILASDAVSLRIISPGLFIELIPEYRFHACYMVQFSSKHGEVLVIAETAYKDNVYIDNRLLSSTGWRPIAQSEYSSVSVTVEGDHVIWHSSSIIGVYMFERMRSGILYGGPAIALKVEPDPLGCLLHSSGFEIIPTPMTWVQSYQNCMLTKGELFSPTSAEDQMLISNFLNDQEIKEDLWIGLRCSLFSLDWYWQKGNMSTYNVSYTHWATGEPGDQVKGMCASTSPNPSNSIKDFPWKSVQCCTNLKSVCYRQAKYFSL
ncbi:uncharacterized protein LOC127656203 isoform X2 [Xyrauchen texanus]|uniref:uncharacterized protein LOC127656203 isoform X2 n=1 Tax=Xyrauchen texanus TaxID=154827 RepID=UPI0022429E42|nr:uncharacterized protein LOC127656203 isoform X2 [Xyrauchen texanus]